MQSSFLLPQVKIPLQEGVIVCEYLYTHIAYLFFLLPPTVKQKQKKEKKHLGGALFYGV